jgi:hypothetical protein
MNLCSVIIPAARSRRLTQILVDDLRACSSITLDVVVASPSFKVKRATNVHDDRIGSAASIALALDHTRSKSTHVAWLSDEIKPTTRCLETMMEFIDRHSPPFIGEFFVGDDGCRAGIRPYARWGMTSRKTIAMIGFFDPAYASFYGDVDFSMRCWEAGGSVAICRDARIQHQGREAIETNKHRHFDSDHARYLELWPAYYPT